ncbi:hypothetical protein RhiirA5_447890 [Rhizophagus irregularis]|uniref:Uncharacterized protein n=1 Tax=Rhizophagus irregularis TaxID=588596 RepID=A0A2N0NAV9_9GLOM|nr:hypothetical protein RhiirA5_447890 [Rhizophagus irregularis]
MNMALSLKITCVLEMQIQDYNESYAIVEAIFSHKGNDNKLWRHVFPLSAIVLINNAHFLHYRSNSLMIY